MKKIALLMVSIISFFAYNINVFAKDTVYSLNKYNDEKLTIIDKSYNSKQKTDGFVVAGTYNKKDDNGKKQSNVIYAKMDTYGNTSWVHSYKSANAVSSNISNVLYLYDEENKITGYSLVISFKDSNDIEKNIFLKIDLNGKVIEEKASSLDENILIKKLIHINNEGYIGIANSNEKAYLIRYDKDFNLIYKKEYQEDNISFSAYQDIIQIHKDNNIIGYATIVNIKKDNSSQIKLINNDLDGNIINTIKDNFEANSNPKLEMSDDGFIVYGITNELKLTNNKSTSYFINTYNSELEEVNDSVGSTPIAKDKVLKLLPVIEDNKIKEYLLLYINDVDSSIEVIKINMDGLENSKIKKINNTYYNISNFNTNNNILYIIGQINCPEDDDCDYNNNSLFLISDQDKVIEVKQSDNRNIIIGTCIFVGLIILLIVLVRKYKKNKK